MEKQLTLIEHYQSIFCTVNANNDNLKEKAYRLRYQIQSHELGITLSDECVASEMEYDQYDDRALHSLLIHKFTHTAIGYIRLIPLDHQHFNHLPIELLCKHSLNKKIIAAEQFQQDKTGEISRFSIHPSFRRRRSDHDYHLTIDNSLSADNRRFSLNYLPICVALAGLNLMIMAEIEYSMALMERSLAIKLKQQGAVLKQIGKPINLYGYRIPFLIDTKKTYKNIKPEIMELFQIISEEYAGIEQFV